MLMMGLDQFAMYVINVTYLCCKMLGAGWSQNDSYSRWIPATQH